MAEEALATPISESAEADYGWNCDLVLAECNDVEGVATAIATAPCQRVMVYSKCSDCGSISDNEEIRAAATAANSTVTCSQLQNRGREQHTFLTHAARYYNDLSDRVYFIPLPLQRHDRRSILQSFVRTETDVSFVCDFYSVSNAAARAPTRYYATRTSGSIDQLPTRIPSPPPPPLVRSADTANGPDQAKTATGASLQAPPAAPAGGVHALSAKGKTDTEFMLIALARTMGGHRRLGDTTQVAGGAPRRRLNSNMGTMNDTNDFFDYAYRFGHPNPCGSSALPDDGPCLDFYVTEYAGANGPVPQTPADVRPLWAWEQAHAGVDLKTLSSVPVCYFGMARTTRANIQARPQEVYERLRDQLALGDQPEAGHYIERLMAATFGPSAEQWSVGSGSLDRSEGWSLAPHSLSSTFVLGMSIGGGVTLACVLLIGWLGLRMHGQRAAAAAMASESEPLSADEKK